MAIKMSFIQQQQQNIRKLLNSDLDFSRDGVPYSTEDEKKVMSKFADSADLYQFMVNSIVTESSNAISDRSVTLPENFDWKNVTSNDPPSMVNKKKLISQPDNQYLCGNCWAMTTVQVMGDRFVVAGLVSWDPNLSSTFAMLYYPQDQCAGGNPSTLLKNITEGIGVASKHCIDFSWCSENSECRTDNSSNYFSSSNKSNLMPSSKGCYFNTKHYMYRTDGLPKIISGVDTINTDDIVTKHQMNLKEEILAHGPAIGGIIILDSFTNGNGAFTKVNGGVYLENVTNYGTGRPVEFGGDFNSYAGNHVVSILGWGVAIGIKISNNQVADVPYWFCRNTWGKQWGDNGYFKIAMYPFNKISQFLKLVSIADQDGLPHKNGGVMICQVVKSPTLETLPTIPVSEIPKILNKPSSYYSKDENVAVGEPISPPVKPSPIPDQLQKEDSSIVIVIIVVSVIVIFVLMKN